MEKNGQFSGNIFKILARKFCDLSSFDAIMPNGPKALNVVCPLKMAKGQCIFLFCVTRRMRIAS